MQTGNRWSGTNPMDLTLKRQQELLKAKTSREDVASIDPGEIRRAALREGIDAGFDAGFAAALQQLRDAGLDVDSVLALDDDDAEDAGDE